MKQWNRTHSSAHISLGLHPKSTTNNNTKTLSYAKMVRYGRELNSPQTKTTQTTPKQKQVNTSQISTHSTPCREQAQTATTQHTTAGTQTDDTPLASNERLTATVDDIIEQILGKQEGVRQILQATHGTGRGD